MAEIVERIPHNTVAYAYLEIKAGSANEFESLREEALKKIPHYAFASAPPTEPVPTTAASVPAESGAGDAATTETPATAPVAADSTAGATPAETPSTEGLSPREIARQRMAQKGA